MPEWAIPWITQRHLAGHSIKFKKGPLHLDESKKVTNVGNAAIVGEKAFLESNDFFSFVVDWQQLVSGLDG